LGMARDELPVARGSSGSRGDRLHRVEVNCRWVGGS
jgi:hypothetical protein